MNVGLVGRKVGMTRVFSDDGSTTPVTVVDVSNNRITQIKAKDIDGYSSVQVAYGYRKPGNVNRALVGHFAKAGVEAGSKLVEFRLDNAQNCDYSVGDLVSCTLFTVGQKVDVTGTSIGKGFTGAIKRHNFSSNRASHGNSVSHNSPGSISMAQDPGRVFPGKRMAGHLGDVKTTTQNLSIVRVDESRQLLLIKGAIPGSKGGVIIIRPAVKSTVDQA